MSISYEKWVATGDPRDGTEVYDDEGNEVFCDECSEPIAECDCVKFTDNSPIPINADGIIEFIDRTVAKLEHLEPGEAIPFDLADIEFLTQEACIDIGRARKCSEDAQATIDAYDEWQEKRNEAS